MKKVLLTSTALVAFAGAAAAEVTLSGWAEMGVAGGDGVTTQFWNDVDVDFTMSGETDNGLTFGANVDLDTGNLGDELANKGDFTVFVSGEFGTLTMGDTDGALDWAMSDPASAYNDPGSIADDETAHWGRQDTYLDGDYDGQILRYDYTYEGFGFAVSVEQDDRSDLAVEADGDDDQFDYNWAVGAKYSGEVGPGNLLLGVGYQQNDYGTVAFGLTDLQVDVLRENIIDAAVDNPEVIDVLGEVFGFQANADEADQLLVALGENVAVWGLSAGYEWDGGFSFGAVYSDWSSDALDSGSHWAIGGGYTFDAFTISANYGEHSFEYNGGGKLETQGWGLAAGYDLGGGLSLLAGYGDSEADITVPTAAGDEKFDTSWDSWSFGLSMSF